MDKFDIKLQAVEKLLDTARREIVAARHNRVIRVINVNEDTWTSPPGTVHECGDECEAKTKNKVGICVITEEEIRIAHTLANRQIEWLNRFYPIKDDD